MLKVTKETHLSIWLLTMVNLLIYRFDIDVKFKYLTSGYEDVVRILLLNKADVRIENNAGTTARKFAESQGNYLISLKYEETFLNIIPFYLYP